MIDRTDALALTADIQWPSVEAHNAFLDGMCAAPDISYPEAAMLASVVNKPSQFVGVVTTFEHAQRHLIEWRKFVETNGIETGIAAPTEKDIAEETLAEKAEKASKAFHDAVRMRAEARENIRQWADEQRKHIRQVVADSDDQWDRFVKEKRANMHALKDRL